MEKPHTFQIHGPKRSSLVKSSRHSILMSSTHNLKIQETANRTERPQRDKYLFSWRHQKGNCIRLRFQKPGSQTWKHNSIHSHHHLHRAKVCPLKYHHFPLSGARSQVQNSSTRPYPWYLKEAYLRLRSKS